MEEITDCDRLGLLSLLLGEPDDFIRTSLQSGSIVEMLEMAFPQKSWESIKSEQQREKMISCINKDYLYLFVGVSSPLASPYASSYFRKEHHRLMDVPAKKILRLMKKWQIRVDDSHHDLPDHIVAINNLVLLLLQMSDESEDKTMQEELLSDVHSIIRDTLVWLPRFIDKIETYEECGFYSMLLSSLKEQYDHLCNDEVV